MRAGVDDTAGVFVVGVEAGAAVFELLHQAVDAVVQDHVGAGDLGLEHFGGGADLDAGDLRGTDGGDVCADPGLESAQGGGASKI